MTGLQREWRVGDLPIDERLMGQVKRYLRVPGVPSLPQVAAVVHALADHTALQQAVAWRSAEGGDSATSVGRWLHDLGDHLEHTHFSGHSRIREECEHGTRVSQCKCGGNRTVVIVPCPEHCPQRSLDG